LLKSTPSTTTTAVHRTRHLVARVDARQPAAGRELGRQVRAADAPWRDFLNAAAHLAFAGGAPRAIERLVAWAALLDDADLDAAAAALIAEAEVARHAVMRRRRRKVAA
jgi:hypothetical protein